MKPKQKKKQFGTLMSLATKPQSTYWQALRGAQANKRLPTKQKKSETIKFASAPLTSNYHYTTSANAASQLVNLCIFSVSWLFDWLGSWLAGHLASRTMAYEQHCRVVIYYIFLHLLLLSTLANWLENFQFRTLTLT